MGRRTALASSVFNLMNAIMGSGLLGLPYILRESGIALFLILIIGMALVVYYSIYLLLRSAKLARVSSYQDLGQHTFGTLGRTIVSVAILVQNTGAMTSYLIVVGELAPSIMQLFLGSDSDSVWVNREFLMCFVTAAFILPLASMRTIGVLSYSSTASVMFMYAYAFVVIAEKFHLGPGECERAQADPSTDDGALEGVCHVQAFNVNINTFLALPTMCFSFVCHTALLPVFKELKEADEMGRTFRGQGRMQLAAKLAIAGACTVYIVVAIFGYLTFYGATEDLIVNSYIINDGDNPAIAAIHIALCMAFVFTIPLIHWGKLPRCIPPLTTAHFACAHN